MNEEFLTKAEYSEYVKRIEEWQKRQDARISETEAAIKEINEINVHLTEMSANIKNMSTELSKQSVQLDALEKKDGDMWQSTVKYVITAVVGGIVAFILAKIGLS